MPVDYLKETPSQTAGPYVHIGLYPSVAGLPVRTQEKPYVLAGPETEGEAIEVEGTVFDGTGAPVRDAVIEVWQADGRGRVGAHGLWGRAAADLKTGLWRIETVKPGAVPALNGAPQAPFITLLVFARGINIQLHTRLYFPEEETANAADPAMKRVEQPARRETLVAEKQGERRYRFDIRLQGEGETVFFDI